ncbi:hypothetical protein UCRPA7_177 [Phaeoacremonium minimum UCRPA7]|uniref:Myb-like DNA-binding domain-containing protein n=1 Tax=Phaeoacremonium minimum (strain UCR-PA7) TaxID=1286976 RepID=R8BY26_PHAM7|nr:hypothetical protein UCRPA7_177 [Phaeoacremonium minimum UCRPA7]EOO04301.1 hypothetical protein UCRPA7_177 [Phaeoacremonium minimum UCRPA7]
MSERCNQIDWNKVAHDPILAQEITNGHAARMRYSRFRSAMLGLEPQRRNRTSGTKSKVTKSKKEPKAKREEAAKPNPETASTQDSAPKTESPKVKQESLPTPAETQSIPISMAAPLIPDTQTQLHNRLLTPCSDTDLLAASHGYATSPASEMLHSEAGYDFTGAASCAHDHASWHQSPAYSAFGVPYELDTFTTGYCDHQHTHHHGGDFGMPTPMIGMDHNVPVKHEEWDARYE